MSDLTAQIKDAENFVSLQPADSAGILAAEARLGLLFAPDYKEYLLAFGAATFSGKELSGICKSERLSVVSLTERARRIYPRFPENAYVIENLGFDLIFIVQDASGRVYSYGPADAGELIAGSLEEYLFPEKDIN